MAVVVAKVINSKGDAMRREVHSDLRGWQHAADHQAELRRYEEANIEEDKRGGFLQSNGRNNWAGS